MKHLYIPRPKKGHIFITGDVHGEFPALMEALKRAGFDFENDILIATGDLVDKGRYSRQAYDWLGKRWFYSVMGNHDWHVANWDGDLESNWIKNWGGWFARLNPVFQQQMKERFAQKLPIAITVQGAGGNVGILHAGTPEPSWIQTLGALANVTKRDHLKPFIFERKYYEEKKPGGAPYYQGDIAALFVGHCPTKSGNVEVHNNIYFMDTDGYKTGEFKLKCITKHVNY